MKGYYAGCQLHTHYHSMTIKTLYLWEVQYILLLIQACCDTVYIAYVEKVFIFSVIKLNKSFEHSFCGKVLREVHRFSTTNYIYNHMLI